MTVYDLQRKVEHGFVQFQIETRRSREQAKYSSRQWSVVGGWGQAEEYNYERLAAEIDNALFPNKNTLVESARLCNTLRLGSYTLFPQR